eukprot:COSAG02_NODE_1092_length_14622_cov_95.061971_10_plen_188_part_00
MDSSEFMRQYTHLDRSSRFRGIMELIRTALNAREEGRPAIHLREFKPAAHCCPCRRHCPPPGTQRLARQAPSTVSSLQHTPRALPLESLQRQSPPLGDSPRSSDSALPPTCPPSSAATARRAPLQPPRDLAGTTQFAVRQCHSSLQPGRRRPEVTLSRLLETMHRMQAFGNRNAMRRSPTRVYTATR